MDDKEQDRYDQWNTCKKTLAEMPNWPIFNEGEVWWCCIGLNIGNELYGKGEQFRRPVLILKKLSANSCIVIPITSKRKHGTWYARIGLNGQDNWAALQQIRMINTKRLQRRITTLTEEDFVLVKEKLKHLLELF
jgi:mRNA interferase MazF